MPIPSDPNSQNPVTRREMFSGLLSPFRRALKAGAEGGFAPRPVPPAPPAGDLIAVIGGRLCLAYHEIACSVCVERCPVPGALVSDSGLPRVVPGLCTGCGACMPVCPAPENAIRMVLRPVGLPKAAPGADSGESAPVERRSSRGQP